MFCFSHFANGSRGARVSLALSDGPHLRDPPDRRSVVLTILSQKRGRHFSAEHWLEIDRASHYTVNTIPALCNRTSGFHQIKVLPLPQRLLLKPPSKFVVLWLQVGLFRSNMRAAGYSDLVFSKRRWETGERIWMAFQTPVISPREKRWWLLSNLNSF